MPSALTSANVEESRLRVVYMASCFRPSGHGLPVTSVLPSSYFSLKGEVVLDTKRCFQARILWWSNRPEAPAGDHTASQTAVLRKLFEAALSGFVHLI